MLGHDAVTCGVQAENLIQRLYNSDSAVSRQMHTLLYDYVTQTSFGTEGLKAPQYPLAPTTRLRHFHICAITLSSAQSSSDACICLQLQDEAMVELGGRAGQAVNMREPFQEGILAAPACLLLEAGVTCF